MAQSIHFSMQTYRKGSQGKLRHAKWIPCGTAEEAIKRAEAVVLAGRAIGAAALEQRCSGEFDEGEMPITLAAFGDVPPETRDQVPY